MFLLTAAWEAQVVRRRPEGAHLHHPAKDVQRRDLVHPAPLIHYW
jgi:hypothetical protein